MKTPVTSARLKEHFRYNWWKYLLIVAVGIGLVDLLYTVTAYRPPRDKTLGVYIYGYADDAGMGAYLENVRETELPDVEEIISVQMLDDSTYGPMQLMAYFSAGEGDLYLLSRETFLSYASGGSMIPLEDDPELMALFDSAGVSLQSGWRRDTETGETHLYGIPQSKLPGLGLYAYATDGFLCMPVSGRNQENAAKLMRILCRDMISEPLEQNEQPDSQATQNEQP